MGVGKGQTGGNQRTRRVLIVDIKGGVWYVKQKRNFGNHGTLVRCMCELS